MALCNELILLMYYLLMVSTLGQNLAIRFKWVPR